MRILTLLFSLLVLLPSSGVQGQNLKLPISNFSNKEYGRNYESTNYCILTDNRNLVYSGNANGILQYDGSRWRFIPVREGAHVVSMDISPDGRIYVGSQHEFGFLGPDASASLVYHSLSDLLPAEGRTFTTIWKTWAGKDMQVFQAEECIFIYQNDSLHAIHPETSFHTSFLVGDSLYARERGSGLKVYRDGTFIPVKDGRIFADLGVFGMFPSGEADRLLIITRERGFYVFDPAKGIKRLHTDNDAFLIRAGIFGGIATRDQKIALNTMHEGVLICNPDGEIEAVVNKHSGLKDDDVKGLCQDDYHNIWCALGRGISRIDFASPVSFYNENAGLEGSVNAIQRFEGKIYVGTSSGLFAEDPAQVLNRSLEFLPLPGIRDQVFSLEVVNGNLAVGTTNGVFVIRNGQSRLVSQVHAYAMKYLPEEGLLLVGGKEGLSALSPVRNWRMVSAFSDISLDVISIAINRGSAYDGSEIWLGSSLQGTVKLLLQPDLSYDFTLYYGMGDGLPEDWIEPIEQGDSVLFGTSQGVRQFIDEEVLKTALPDSLKDRPEFYRGYFEPARIYGEKSSLPLRYSVQSYGNLWAILNNRISLIPSSAPDSLIEKPFLGIDLGELQQIYPDDENTVWFGASEGLARFDLGNMNRPEAELLSLIRTVRISGDSLIFNGAPRPRYRADDLLDYSHNDLTFFVSAPFYDNEQENRFSWMLEGKRMMRSSGWSDRNIISFTNLREGNYTFRVRMMNIYGDVSAPATFGFTIRPPWPRTLPAYLVYLILVLVAGYLVVKAGQTRLRRKNERLEAIVAERTEEIRKQNLALAVQKKEITDSIYYAERIQRAILPKTGNLDERISEYFILFRPKDIVSGDFYWLAESEDRIIITAVDCTGHGVPGAFMSMLGVSFLNKIILENKVLEADAILNALRDNVIGALKQTGQEGEARDGMDMALVVIDMKNMTLEFAGANNPLYIVREDELNETKADRMPIAYYMDGSSGFTKNTIKLAKGDALYMCSDGFADQFGGPRGKKFMYKPFKRLLAGLRDQRMKDIKETLENTLDEWMAPESGTVHEQVDDILVIGLRV